MPRYIVRKYIMANSAKEAIRKEKSQEVDDVWVDDEWKKMQDELLVVGFSNKKTNE